MPAKKKVTKKAPAKRRAKKKAAPRPAADPAAATAAVERALKKNAGASTADLRKAATRYDARLKELSPRSFNARFVLGAKRRLGLMKTRKKKAGGAPIPKKKRGRRAAPVKLMGDGGAPIPLSAEQMDALRKLVLARDKKVLRTLTGKNAAAAYQLAAELDDYVDQVVRAVRG